jgi:myo-inositol-1(or 4)-monophosphatase
MQANYLDELNLAKVCARKAGKILMNSFGSATAYGKAAHDLGTKPEVLAENHIKQLIHKKYPQHNLVGEESGSTAVGSDYTWIIDPCDGTRNYLLGIPYFSISIALKVGRTTVLGVVYNPCSSELFYARKGCGAFRGRKQLFVSDTKREMADAIVCSDWGGSVKDDEEMRRGLRNLETLIFAARTVVVHFSPALDLCLIALGKADVLVTLSTEVEDHAAGALVVQEAGGVVTNFGSNRWHVGTRGIVAANRPLHTALRQLL